MAVKNSDKNQWTDPKDYGLPWVEIKPIVPNSSKEQKTEGKVLSPEPAEELKLAKEPVVISPADPKPKSESKEKPASKKVEKTAKKEKKSNSLAWIVVVLAIVIVAAIIWQLQFNGSVEQIEKVSETKPEITAGPSPKVEEIDEQIASAEELQDTVNQETKEIISDSNPNISKPVESGTTIAQSVLGNLIRIENQAERPQYFIVVGSLPSESEALKLAPNYQSKVSEVYMIHPYTESSNFRLAIGKFTSFRKAAEELEKIKSQYSEELWILKY